MTNEQLRMQFLSGVITESEYKTKLEELNTSTEKDSLNEHYVAGGIVGIGAINQIPPRAKTDYEDAFEHFLGQKYDLNESEDDMPKAPSHEETDAAQVYEEEINEGVGNSLNDFIDSFEFSQKGNDELIDFANRLLDGDLSKEEFEKLKSFFDELEFFKLVSDPNRGIKSIAQQIYKRLKQGIASDGGVETFATNPEALQALRDKVS